ncbi:MAG: hypothetical protein ACI9WU_001004 [Myxococcota bacterium]|jgi:uncharacterized protein (TIRG00374 family)
MSQTTRTGLKWLVGVALGILFMWLAALDWPLDRLFGAGLSLHGTVLSSGQAWAFDMVYLVPYFGVLSAIHFLRVIRWYPLLRPLADVDFKRLNRVSAVGFMYLFLLPLRLGELARPYLIADRGDIKMTQALATVVVERVVDGLIVSIALFIVLTGLPGDAEATSELRLGAWLALAVFGGALLVLLAGWKFRTWTLTTLDRLIRPVSAAIATKVRNILQAFFEGLEGLPHPRYFWSFVGWSMVYWALNGYGYYVLALGFEGLHIPLLAAYAMMCCVVVGMMLPNPPGNVGVFWYFLLKPLTLYGVAVGDPTATAFGLMAWFGQFVQQTGFGLWFTLRGRSERNASKAPGGSARVATDPP